MIGNILVTLIIIFSTLASWITAGIILTTSDVGKLDFNDLTKTRTSIVGRIIVRSHCLGYDDELKNKIIRNLVIQKVFLWPKFLKDAR